MRKVLENMASQNMASPSGLRQPLATKGPFKTMKNAFSFRS